MFQWLRVLGRRLGNVPKGQGPRQGQHRSPRASLQKVVGFLIAVSHALLMQAGRSSGKSPRSLAALLAVDA